MQDDQNLVIYDTNNIPYWAIFGSFNGIGQLLTNYWSMSSLSDIISGSDLYGGSNYSFTTDRFGNNNSAIYWASVGGNLEVMECLLQDSRVYSNVKIKKDFYFSYI